MTPSSKPNPAGVVTITLGWVVLDRPDQSGLYIAKDLSAGWAYLIADEDGDNRHRGQGPCAGGLEVALRCAVLAAIACVPDCTQLRLIVDTRLAHRAMVQLALQDPRVAGAIGRRQATVMTRPLERSTQLVQAAAERAASDKLRERERAEWHDVPVHAETTTEIPALAPPVHAAPDGWRRRIAAASAPVAGPAAAPVALPVPVAVPVPATPAPGGVRRLLGPMLGPVLGGIMPGGALGRLLGGPPRPARNEALSSWLRELDSQIDSVRTDLEDVGA